MESCIMFAVNWSNLRLKWSNRHVPVMGMIIIIILVVLTGRHSVEGRRTNARRNLFNSLGSPAYKNKKTTPILRAKDFCPTRKCKCQKSYGLWHMRCALPLSRLPRFRQTNVTLETATIARRNLTKVPKNSFQKLTVRHLDLSGNVLTSGVSRGAFNNLGHVLESLSLAHCFLPKVPISALKEIPKVKVLHLEHNEIKELRTRGFSECSQLRDLSLYRNRIQKIERNAFEGLKVLEELRLSHNVLKEIQRKMLAGMPSLMKLDLSDNQIKRITAGTFKDMTQLKWLELGGNDISYLTGSVMRGLDNLKYMKLDRNPLIRIQDRSFLSTQHLRYLSLEITNITTITDQSFSGLVELTTLDLGEVNRRRLPKGVFSSLGHLKFLSFSDKKYKFQGLYRRHFAHAQPEVGLHELSVWVVPMRHCSCHVPWILEMTAYGAYVHGYCYNHKTLSCKRRRRAEKGSDKRREKEVVIL